MTSEGVRVDRDGAVATIVLDHPDVLNRFEDGMREALLDAIGAVGTEPGVRVVVITGAGPAFSAGADVNGMLALHRAGDAAEIRRRVELGGRIVAAIQTMPKPVIAAVNGVAAGAGANLALGCDIRVGSDRARIVESFVRIGLIPDWGGFSSLVGLVGPGTAADLMMTGEPLDAARAHALGVLQYVWPADEFERATADYARALAAMSPGALAAIKDGIRRVTGTVNTGILDYEAATQSRLFLSEDCRRGLLAFVARGSTRTQANGTPRSSGE